MEPVWYDPWLVTDRQTGRPRIDVRGLQGTIVVRGTTTPLTLTDANGLAVSQPVLVSEDSFIPGFNVVEGLVRADWLSAGGAIRIPIWSPVGLEESAQAAWAAAELARAAAESVAEAATKLQIIQYGDSTEGYAPNTLIVELPPGVTL